MLSLHEIEIFLQHTPIHLQDIVLELRNLIVSVVPDAAEVIRWGGLSYFHKGRGGIVSAGICQIGIHEDHVRRGPFRERPDGEAPEGRGDLGVPGEERPRQLREAAARVLLLQVLRPEADAELLEHPDRHRVVPDRRSPTTA